MILPVSNLSDLIENELATGGNSGTLFGKISTFLEHNYTATVTMATTSKLLHYRWPADIRALQFRDRPQVHEADAGARARSEPESR